VGEVGRRPPPEGGEHLVLNAKGHAVFQAPEGAEGYAVVAEAAGPGGPAPFDSRQLGGDDLFAVTLIRPGTYTMTNLLTGAEGRITVAYPTVGDRPYQPPDPVSVECTKQGFAPDTIDLQPAQGIIFRFGTPSRIKIDLVEPLDRPAGPAEERGRRRVAHWRRPGARRDRAGETST
jgi:hypothetical protein